MADMDLILDTFPYNGHTTTQDALFNSRTPVISIRGENFASRVSYSLLKLFSLEDLSVLNISEYVEIAVNLYNSPGKLNEINKKIEYNLFKNKIFSMKSFTKSLEELFLDIQV